jgi:transposase-like protein
MKTRKWTGQQKLQILFEGIKGSKSISELCTKYEVSQGQYYKWRDQLINQGSRIFEESADKEKAKLERENMKLKNLIGELTVELKKNEYDL